MACFRIHIAAPIVHLGCDRPLGPAEWKAALSQLTADEKFTAGSFLLVTQQGSPGACDLTAETLDAASMLISRYIPPLGNRVALAIAEDFQYGLGRMLEAFCSSRGVDLRVFRAMPEARQWLEDELFKGKGGLDPCSAD